MYTGVSAKDHERNDVASPHLKTTLRKEGAVYSGSSNGIFSDGYNDIFDATYRDDNLLCLRIGSTGGGAAATQKLVARRYTGKWETFSGSGVTNYEILTGLSLYIYTYAFLSTIKVRFCVDSSADYSYLYFNWFDNGSSNYYIYMLGSTDMYNWGNTQIVSSGATFFWPNEIAGVGGTALYLLENGKLMRVTHNGSTWTGITNISPYASAAWNSFSEIDVTGVSGKNYLAISGRDSDTKGAYINTYIDDYNNVNLVRQDMLGQRHDELQTLGNSVRSFLFTSGEIENIIFPRIGFQNNKFNLTCQKVQTSVSSNFLWTTRDTVPYALIFAESKDFDSWSKKAVGFELTQNSNDGIYKSFYGMSNANDVYFFCRGCVVGDHTIRAKAPEVPLTADNDISSLSNDNNATMRLELSNTGVY